MNKQVLLVAEAVSNEKEVNKEIIFSAIEAALASATKKRYGIDSDIRVSIDRQTGEYETFRRWTIVANPAELILPEQQMTLDQAKGRYPQIKIGEVVEEPLPSIEFGRIAAQTAKQVILQKVREAERYKIAEEYKTKLGQIIAGTVKRVTREGVLLDVGNNIEGLIPREEMIPRQDVRKDDRLRAYLYEVRLQPRGPLLYLSRSRPQFLIELFKIEVPEIAEELVQIKSAARDPGSRAKIAVKTNDGRIDPVGACVGMRGARVQAVSGELCGERIDIVIWDDNLAQLVINAMAPAEVSSIVVDENKNSIDVVVPDDQLSQAIGRNGQNVKLASQLTHWTLNVMTAAEAADKTAHETENLKQVFIDKLGVSEDIAEILVREGFTDIEEVAYVSTEELEKIEEFDEGIVQALQERAKNVLLAEALSDQEPSAELLALEGMTSELAKQLAKKGIKTRDDLAEQSVDDLLEITALTEEQAARLIMAARAHWFQ